MADIKTHLRELSPLLAFVEDTVNIEILTPNEFIEIINKTFPTLRNIPLNMGLNSEFTDTEKLIISRGIKLGETLIRKFEIDKVPEVEWSGNSTHSLIPVDLKINNIKISLKEESFILENMGLYRYINLMTGKDSNRGSSHIFMDFAAKEYNEWFNYSWNYLVKSQLDWEYTGRDYKSSIKFLNDKVLFQYNEIKTELPNEVNLGIEAYTRLTTNKIREKVFSKWLKQFLERDNEYLRLKKKCSISAGDRLVNYINQNLNPTNINLRRLLRVYDEEYYYAKTTKLGVKVYRIPNSKEFSQLITIDEIKFSVPNSQLNIITTLQNTLTKSKLILRNEVRFSHGQFNGTPEAKMYYDKSSDLSTIYIPV